MPMTLAEPLTLHADRFAPDTVHLNAEGNRHLVAALRPALRALWTTLKTGPELSAR